ncbi:MAG: ion channel [Thermodesulfobacteriota bacterium]
MTNFFDRDRYGLLLVCLLFFIAGMPLIENFFELKILTAILFSLISISAIYGFTRQKRTFIVSIVLFFPLIICTWWNYINDNIYSQLASTILNIVFLTYITYNIFISTFRARIVNLNVIHGAIVIYLLIGFIWSFIYALIESLHPGSFSHISEKIFGHRPLVYFSFVTLTTLGFGDITPLTPLAQSLVILEAITGQIYLIIQVSWLVGLYVAHTREQRKP